MTVHPLHRPPWRRRLLTAQSLYYIATGLWPLLSMATFELATGPKIDNWLVKMVACLVVVIGATIGLATWKGHSHAIEVVMLSAGSALAFVAVDVWYAVSGRISPIYLADAALELALLAALWRTRRRHRGVHYHHPPPYLVERVRLHDARPVPRRDPAGRKRHRPLS